MKVFDTFEPAAGEFLPPSAGEVETVASFEDAVAVGVDFFVEDAVAIGVDFFLEDVLVVFPMLFLCLFGVAILRTNVSPSR